MPTLLRLDSVNQYASTASRGLSSNTTYEATFQFAFPTSNIVGWPINANSTGSMLGWYIECSGGVRFTLQARSASSFNFLPDVTVTVGEVYTIRLVIDYTTGDLEYYVNDLVTPFHTRTDTGFIGTANFSTLFFGAGAPTFQQSEVDIYTFEEKINGVLISSYAPDRANNRITDSVGARHATIFNLSGTGSEFIDYSVDETYTADLMDVTSFTVDTVGLPFTSALYQNEIEVTDGASTASINIDRNPKAGWTTVDTVGAVDTLGSIFEGRAGGAPADGSQIYYPTAGNTAINAQGIITTDESSVSGNMWNVVTGEWESFEIIFSSLPTANAGTDQTVNENTLVTLDGSGSAGTIDTYTWSQTAGTIVTLSDVNAVQPTFTAPDLTANETLTFQLEVSNTAGSTTDTVDINVTDVVVPPIANAGIDQSVDAGEVTTLDGSGSTGSNLSYLWEQISGESVSLSGATQIQPAFTAPSLPTPNQLVFRLTVSNGAGSDSDEVTIDVAAQVNPNNPPIANAGVDRNVSAGVLVRLDGSGSYDPDGDPITYEWSQTSGTPVTLSSITAEQPTFISPIGESPVQLEFNLEVSDGTLMDNDQVTIDVAANIPPPEPPEPEPTPNPIVEITIFLNTPSGVSR